MKNYFYKIWREKILTNKYFWFGYRVILLITPKAFDPQIRFKVGKKRLFMNFSHRLPLCYYLNENYDRALPRICKNLKDIDGFLSVIDVGANIGDTVFLITDEVGGDFLCIDGDEKYLPFLEKNISQLNTRNKIVIEKTYCGTENIDNLSVDRGAGTAKIVTNTLEKNNLKIQTLDNILKKNPHFLKSNILKIDTDGFEIKVVEGGQDFIKITKPLIYFEFTPNLYLQNNEDVEKIWNILSAHGYKKALFYNNFGKAIEIINIEDKDAINNLIKKIDYKNIYYFDVLTYHDDKDKYFKILENELYLFQ